MNSKINILISLGILFLQGCSNNPESFNVQTAEAKKVAQPVKSLETYSVDVERSVIQWVGTKVLGQHKGTINLMKGNLFTQSIQIESGNITIDMRSLKVTDMKEVKGQKLANHLMNEDFFHAEKYQTATVEIIKVVPHINTTTDENSANQDHATHDVSVNITMMDSTKSITFPALIEFRGDEMITTANFNIDRTQWGVHYKAASSFGDKRIYPMVNIDIKIFAKKQ